MACALNGCIFKCVICEFIHYSSTRYLQLGISRFQFEKTTSGWGEQLAIVEHRYGDKFQSITFAFNSGINEMDHPGLHLTPSWQQHLSSCRIMTIVFEDSPLFCSIITFLDRCFNFMRLFSLLFSPLQCNNDYTPVCGSNNQNYQNECFLRRDACKQQSEVLIMSEGACPAGMYISRLYLNTHSFWLTRTSATLHILNWGNMEHGNAHISWTFVSKHMNVSIFFRHRIQLMPSSK